MSVTIFQIINKSITLQEIEKKLKKKITPKEVNDSSTGNTIKLKTTIEKIKLEKSLRATICYDHIDSFFDRDGKENMIVKNTSIDFTFMHGSGIYLLVCTGREPAGKIASSLSTIIFNRDDDPILSCQINPNKMEGFIQKHNSIILSCSWKNINIPNLNIAMINGANLEEIQDFKRFDSHGVKHSLRIKIPSLHITLSINRYASLHIYTRIDENEREKFIKEQILPLCS